MGFEFSGKPVLLITNGAEDIAITVLLKIAVFDHLAVVRCRFPKNLCEYPHKVTLDETSLPVLYFYHYNVDLSELIIELSSR